MSGVDMRSEPWRQFTANHQTFLRVNVPRGRAKAYYENQTTEIYLKHRQGRYGDSFDVQDTDHLSPGIVCSVLARGFRSSKRQ